MQTHRTTCKMRITGDFRSIQGRGGKVVVVDPRRTETAKVADEHLAIRPGTDLFLLVGMIKRILQAGTYDEALPRALQSPLRASVDFPLILISGGRRSASYNTWTHNIPELMAKLNGNWATLSRVDAERLGVEDGTTVQVVSRTGALEIRAVVSDEIREGVVMIHQFWGHKYESGMKTSRSHPGENVNFLHDDCVRDTFTGMPVFNGTPCRVEVI